MWHNKYKIILFVSALIGFVTLLLVATRPQLETQAIVKIFPSRNVKILAEQLPISTTKLISKEYQLINIWASWCAICQSEHSFLKQIATQDIPIIGVNYRDKYDAALNYLNKLGNPYQNVIYDPKGKLSIDLGVIGTPETYLMDQKGQIIFKYSGLLNKAIWNKFFSHYFKKEE